MERLTKILSLCLKIWLPSTQRIAVEDLVKFLNEHRRNMEQPYYLPAARSGIMQSHRVIASSLVARSHSRRPRTLVPRLPTLSGVVTDFMQQIDPLRGTLQNQTKGMNQIANTLTSDVLAGQIIMRNPSPTGYPEFLYRPQGTEQGYAPDSFLINGV